MPMFLIVHFNAMVYRYSLQSELLLWVSKDVTDKINSPRNQTAANSSLIAYIRFGGLPTPENYVASFSIPQYPDAIALRDDSPSDQGTIYIGKRF